MATLPNGFVLDGQALDPTQNQEINAVTDAGLPEGFVIDNAAGSAAPSKQSWVMGMLDQTKAGATAGFDADAEAFLTAPSASDPKQTTHNDRRNAVKARQERFLADNPVTGRVGYYGGLAASMAGLGPLLRGLGMARAATAAEAVTGMNNVERAGAIMTARTANQARVALPGAAAAAAPTPASIPRLMHEFGKMGAKGSALTTLGEAKGPLPQRAEELMTAVPAGYAFGAALGPPMAKAGELAGRGATYMSELLDRARTEGGNVANGAARTTARALTDDGVPNANVILNDVMPAYGRGASAIPQAEVVNILERYGNHMASGLDDLGARQALVQEMVQAGGVSQRTAEGRVRAIVQRYNDRNAVPSQLHELAALHSQGEAANTFGLYRFGANMPTEGNNKSAAIDFARRRQESQGGRLAEIFERYLGNGDVNAAVAGHEARINHSNGLYRPILEQFEATPGAREALQRAIQGVHDETNAALKGRQDDIASAAFGHLNKFRNKVSVPGDEHYVQVTDPKTGGPMMMQMEDGSWQPRMRVVQNPSLKAEPAMDDLAGFIGQRGALRDAADSAFRDGKGNLGSELKALKNRLDEAVRGLGDDATLPDNVRNVFAAWREANDNRASASALQGAWRDGTAFPISAGGGRTLEMQAQMMRQFSRMNPERQEMFLMGLMGQIRAKLERPSSTSDVSRFMRTDQGRRVLAHFFGDNAERVQTALARAGIATRTHAANKGSQTAPMLETGKHINGLIELAANITNPMYYLRGAGNIAARQLERGRNDELMRLLGANTDNPAELVAALRTIASAQQMRQTVFNSNLQQHTRNAAGVGVGTLSGTASRGGE